MPPRDRLTAKEIQVATLVWQGLTNKDIARVLITSEQVVKNYLRTTFDKLGVWTRLELALYVASHGGANWHVQLGNGLLSPAAGWSASTGEEAVPFADAGRKAAAALLEGRLKVASRATRANAIRPAYDRVELFPSNRLGDGNRFHTELACRRGSQQPLAPPGLPA